VPHQFESNLVSVIAFHAYMILGMDADTFELNGGRRRTTNKHETLLTTLNKVVLKAGSLQLAALKLGAR